MAGEAFSPAIESDSPSTHGNSAAEIGREASPAPETSSTQFSPGPEFPALVSGILNNISFVLFGASFPILAHWLTVLWSGIVPEDWKRTSGIRRA